jgi:hypothetical protein
MAGGTRLSAASAVIAGLTILRLLAVPTTGVTQELVARAYTNTPVGLNFIAVGYGYSAGNVFFDPALPFEDTDARINAVFVRYVRSLELFGKPAKIKAALPWTTGHWEGFLDGEHRTRDATGLADVRLGFDILVSGAPPLEPAGFAAFQQRTIIGLSFEVIIPTGKYEPTKLINISSNRWAFNPELAVSQNLGGGWTGEAVGSVWLFTDNNDFFDGLTLEQDTLFALKLSAIHTVRPGFWWGFGLVGLWPRLRPGRHHQGGRCRATDLAAQLAIRGFLGLPVCPEPGRERGADERRHPARRRGLRLDRGGLPVLVGWSMSGMFFPQESCHPASRRTG